MKILIACECSGMIRDAFLALGHDAMSCDLKPTQRPGPHHQGDVRDILYQQWDMLIAHPVCKFMANSGNKHLYLRIEGKWAKENGKNEERWEKMKAGAEFFNLFDRADHIPLRCVENPIMNGHALGMVGRIATQFVQPHWFGDPFSKATGLWLTGFKPLVRTHWIDPATIQQAVWKMPPSDDREEKRSETYPGIAFEMARQWGGDLVRQAAE